MEQHNPEEERKFLQNKLVSIRLHAGTSPEHSAQIHALNVWDVMLSRFVCPANVRPKFKARALELYRDKDKALCCQQWHLEWGKAF
jgi:hypothetical protein